MEIKINKEIKDYQESIFFGLSGRQFICALMALIIAVLLYFSLKAFIGKETASWLCIIGAAPFAFAGFFKYNGLKLEQFLIAVIQSHILYSRRLVYSADNIYFEALRKERKYDIW